MIYILNPLFTPEMQCFMNTSSLSTLFLLNIQLILILLLCSLIFTFLFLDNLTFNSPTQSYSTSDPLTSSSFDMSKSSIFLTLLLPLDLFQTRQTIILLLKKAQVHHLSHLVPEPSTQQQPKRSTRVSKPPLTQKNFTMVM